MLTVLTALVTLVLLRLLTVLFILVLLTVLTGFLSRHHLSSRQAFHHCAILCDPSSYTSPILQSVSIYVHVHEKLCTYTEIDALISALRN